VVLAVVGAAVHQGAAVVGAAVGLTGAAVVPGGSTVVGAAVGLPVRDSKRKDRHECVLFSKL
jgi:hypothetical protein